MSFTVILKEQKVSVEVSSSGSNVLSLPTGLN